MERKPVPTSPVPEAPPGTLSDRHNGVIVPPKGIDPEMHKAPPEEGTMRVIPPPGAPKTPFGGEPK